MKNINQKQNVAIGMSGGVDSTMAAYLLKKQEFDVVGLTMKIWDNSVQFESSRSGCYGPNETKEIAEAQAAAKKIGIPHFVINLEKEYQKYVLDYFRKEYSCGRTPNPCVFCNAKIKFGYLLKYAVSGGIKFDQFATGHYARVEFEKKSGRYLLKQGVDKFKDQSYFLHRLKQSQLKRVVFPLGNYQKTQIKKIAAELGYEDYSNKRESQDFLECADYGVLFEKSKEPRAKARGIFGKEKIYVPFIPTTSRGVFRDSFHKLGNIVNLEGNILGTHRGIIFYTIGQRKNLNLGGLKEPYYVLKIDARKNEVIVGPKQFLYSKKLLVKNLNWIALNKCLQQKTAHAKIRSTASLSLCTINPIKNNQATIEFEKPQLSITPGQSIVFYEDDIVLGGGIIAKKLDHADI